MAQYASQLIGKVSIEGAEKAKRDLEGVGKETEKTQKHFEGLGHALSSAAGYTMLGGAAVGAGLLGLGVISSKMAGDFQAGMTSLVTGAGEAEKNIGLVSQGILKMSVDTGTTTKQLTEGMYMIESAGFHGAAGLKVLQAAAEGAKVGNADLATVANGVTTIMVDYAKQHVTAAQATNMLVATVAAGKTHMQDLAAALSTIAPTAAAVGLHVTDMNAALATMTGEGTAAADASTYLRQLLMSLEAPASNTVKTLKEIGLTSAQVSDEMKVSLPETLQLITDHLKKKFPEGSAAYVNALKDIAGGSKQMEGILQLTGTHLQTFKDNVTGITDSVKKGGDSITGWSKVQEDFNFTLDKAKSMVEALAIKVGTDLLPSLSDLMNKNILPLITKFSDWMTKGGGLQDLQNWMKTASAFMQNQLIPTFTDLLTKNIIPLAQWVFSLWQDAVNLFVAFQEGQPYADAIAGGLAAIGTAIVEIKIGEFAAGLYNSFNELKAGAGVIANVANEALPNLGRALGWTTTQAEATSVAVEGIGTEAVVAEGEVAVASAGMTLALGVATAGIAVIVGLAVAGIAQVLATGENGMQQATKKAYDDLGQSSDDMKAKAKADATETQSYWQQAADNGANRWKTGAVQMEQASTDAKVKMILDQQAIADAAEKAAQRADDAWAKVSQSGDIIGLLHAAGWNDAKIAKYLGQPVVSDSGTTLASGKKIAAHASGILNNPLGHWATVGERGPEMMYVPQGASILPSGTLPGMANANSNTPVVLMLDGMVIARGLMPYQVDLQRQMTGVRF